MKNCVPSLRYYVRSIGGSLRSYSQIFSKLLVIKLS